MNEMIKNAVIVSAISQKTNKPYYQLLITFSNGYELKTFLNQEQAFILKEYISR